MLTLREIFDLECAFAEEALLSTGVLPAKCYLYTDDSVHTIPLMDGDRKTVYNMVRVGATALGAHTATLITEAWTLDVPKGEELGVIPSKSENRKESLIVFSQQRREDDSFQTLISARDMVRDEAGKIVALRNSVIPEDSDMVGPAGVLIPARLIENYESIREIAKSVWGVVAKEVCSE